jgi:kynureninase
MGEIVSTGTLDEADALARDAADPMARLRDEFLFPTTPDGEPKIYLAGMSLGLQPKGAKAAIERELEAWQQHGVDGWLAPDGWYTVDERLRESMARIVGARPSEVAIANSLTINLHLLLATFYRPTAERPFLLVDGPTFPSDRYAVASVIRQRGFNPDDVLVIVEPKPGEAIVAMADLADEIKRRGPRLALALLAGVNYATGQRHDIGTLTDVVHEAGAFAGWDLAHAAGNVPLQLHNDGVDFAAWCTYKYLNSGPGGPGAFFVHEDHGSNPALPRLAGWWGNDPAVRFKMEPDFVPRAGADGWRVSTPSALAIAPLYASLALFDEAGLDTLRAKSVALTAYLEQVVTAVAGDRVEIITPAVADARGAQLSLRIRAGGEAALAILERLEAAGVVADFREPDLIRVAPVPLYSSFHDCWRFGRVLAAELAAGAG